MATVANHVLLRRITLTASASSVTFDSIPQTGYTDLKIVSSMRCDVNGADDDVIYRYNSDSTAGRYSYKTLYGNGTSAASGGNASASFGYFGRANGATSTASTFSNGELYIPSYTAAIQKSSSINTVRESNAVSGMQDMFANLYNQTTAISTITIQAYSSNFVAGSSFSLYGIADVNTTPKLAPKADGGDIIKTDGTYWYHAFLASGSFKPQVNLTADVLVVAGGGGGGSGAAWETGGGGGAGGVQLFSNQTLTAISNAIIVGAGGAGSSTQWGNPGSNSQFAALTASVGGGRGNGNSGAGGTPATFLAGGSGGGGMGNYNTGGGNGTSGQGNAGGSGGAVSDSSGGGGGGGAGSAGGNAPNPDGGAGGAGVNTYASWLSATNLGVSGYIAGGGGGSASYYQGGNGGAAGSGGGGAGAVGNYHNTGATNGASAVGSTGSGGGGARGNGSGGNGGSGIIIIRYPV